MKDPKDRYSSAHAHGYNTAKLDFQLAMHKCKTPFPMMAEILAAVDMIIELRKADNEEAITAMYEPEPTQVFNMLAQAIAEPIRQAN